MLGEKNQHQWENGVRKRHFLFFSGQGTSGSVLVEKRKNLVFSNGDTIGQTSTPSWDSKGGGSWLRGYGATGGVYKEFLGLDFFFDQVATHRDDGVHHQTLLIGAASLRAGHGIEYAHNFGYRVRDADR